MHLTRIFKNIRKPFFRGFAAHDRPATRAHKAKYFIYTHNLDMVWPNQIFTVMAIRQRRTPRAKPLVRRRLKTPNPRKGPLKRTTASPKQPQIIRVWNTREGRHLSIHPSNCSNRAACSFQYWQTATPAASHGFPECGTRIEKRQSRH